MKFRYRKALPTDAAECIVLRGNTRENAFSVAQLEAIGVTNESWQSGIERDEVPGYVCLGCSSDPNSRSYGFYRHLGWTSIGSNHRRLSQWSAYRLG
ncbi:MAG: hypothetical protein PVH85_11685 [Desulfobacterales bacterium]|jgi:hypothetical protein